MLKIETPYVKYSEKEFSEHLPTLLFTVTKLQKKKTSV